MTTLRPERPADGPMSYETTGQFRAVVGQLNDPLNDPLPSRTPQPPYEAEPAPEAFTPDAFPETFPPETFAQGYPEYAEYSGPSAEYAADHAEYSRYPDYSGTGYQNYPAEQEYAAEQGYPEYPAAEPEAVPEPAPVDVPDPGPEAVAESDHVRDPVRDLVPPVPDPAADGGDRESVPGAADGGRAARRKAAKSGHRARSRAADGTATGPEASAPLSRIEARRAARAAKESPAVVASRVIGEVFITTGVLMLLFVTYQLWWTNVRAHAQANSASNKLEQQWKSDQDDPDRAPGTFSPGQGFAIMYIPKLDVKAPIAQGVSKTKVLDHGMIGHYDGALNTAMPWDKSGNFAVAAHRNTHGEPFRYINHLQPGDKVVVETATTYYTYVITNSLASTPPSNVSVLQPIPVGSGFTKPGRYLTLTTCTPEFTSTNRLIVWGKLTEERPRSKGKPDALVNG